MTILSLHLGFIGAHLSASMLLALGRIRVTPATVFSLGSQCRSYSRDSRRHLADVLNDANAAEDVTVTGFVQTVRKQKKIAFVALSDGSSLEPLQAVLHPDQAEL
jgi:aspartyl/asparaginyl-tRNA synthetase